MDSLRENGYILFRDCLKRGTRSSFKLDRWSDRGLLQGWRVYRRVYV